MLKKGVVFLPEQLEELEGLVDYDLLVDLDRENSRHVFFENDDEEDDWEDDEEDEEVFEEEEIYEEHNLDVAKGPGKFFAGLAFLGAKHEYDRYQESKMPKYRIGDHVRVRYRGQEGTIIDINGGLYTISLDDGRYVDSYDESQIRGHGKKNVRYRSNQKSSFGTEL